MCSCTLSDLPLRLHCVEKYKYCTGLNICPASFSPQSRGHSWLSGMFACVRGLGRGCGAPGVQLAGSSADGRLESLSLCCLISLTSPFRREQQ